MSKVIFECQNLCKTYQEGPNRLDVLTGIDCTIASGARVAIVGPSGSGKSTLLHLLGGLDRPTSGRVMIHSRNWLDFSERDRCQYRNKTLGFIYQFHHLLPEFTALENVAMALLLAGMPVKIAHARAADLLGEVGLSHRINHKPAQLSGGERQRVAIARALVNEPDCVLADEPTGNLDETTAQKVFDLMLELNQRINTALVIVTHDLRLANQMESIMTLQVGRLV
jgi:lipoprotein-releasing system ATP-binding protein